MQLLKFLHTHHTHGRSGRIALYICNLCNRIKWAVSFTTQRNSRWYPMRNRKGAPHSQSGHFGDWLI